MTDQNTDRPYVVILAGGSGTRLWPLARRRRPKPFLPLFGGRSLFGLTWARARALSGASRVIVVCGEEHAPWVRQQAPGLPADRIIREAEGRNTAPSVALAAHWIRSRGGDPTMIVLAADHWIEPLSRFLTVVRRAVRFARRSDALVTIGIPPRSPDPGFGWIERGTRTSDHGIWRASRFVEKPRAEVARRLYRSSRYLWNSGLFVWRTSSILAELERYEPALERTAAAWARAGAQGCVSSAIMRRMPAVPIDRAVLERSSRVFVIRAGFRWSDLGTWIALIDVLNSRPARRASLGDQVRLDAEGCVGFNPGGLTAFVGVSGLMAIRAGDVVLVCRRDGTHRVRDVVGSLHGRLWHHV